MVTLAVPPENGIQTPPGCYVLCRAQRQRVHRHMGTRGMGINWFLKKNQLRVHIKSGHYTYPFLNDPETSLSLSFLLLIKSFTVSIFIHLCLFISSTSHACEGGRIAIIIPNLQKNELKFREIKCHNRSYSLTMQSPPSAELLVSPHWVWQAW